jgi:hypothetical protein
MPVLRGRPSRWRGIHHLVTSRKPDDLPQFDEAVIEMFCAAKQVAPSVSPMASDPGGAFALGHRAASWRLCRAKSMRGRILAAEPPSPWPRFGTIWYPHPLGIQFKPATQPRRNNISRASDDRDLEI